MICDQRCKWSKAGCVHVQYVMSYTEFTHQRELILLITLQINFMCYILFFLMAYFPFLSFIQIFCFIFFFASLTCVSISHFSSLYLLLSLSLQLHLSPTHTHTHTHTHAHPPCLFGCLCSTGSKSLAAACSSPNLPSLCTIALGTKLRPHNSHPARVNSRANTVKAKTHFLLSPTSPAKN